MQFNWSYLPNLITGIRFLLIYPILQAFFIENYIVAFYLLLIAGCTDALDGELARLYGWESKIGAFLDPLADKALLMSVFASLSYLAKIPWQLSIIFIGRDILIMLGVLLYRIAIGPITYQAVFISKINTVLQFLLALCVLLQLSYWHIPHKNIMILSIAVTMTSIASIIQYAWVWGLKAWAYIHGTKV